MTTEYELSRTPARSAESPERSHGAELQPPSARPDTFLSDATDARPAETETPLGTRPLSSANNASSSSEDEQDHLTGFKLLAVVGSITLVIFILLLDVSIISTAIPRITTEFHALDDVGWYAAVYQLASATLQPPTGKIYQHFSSKWVFILFVLLFEVGSLICGVASSSAMFIGGRTIAGLGGSGLINGGLTIIAGVVPVEKRAFYTSITMGVGQLGLISGPLIGGALTQYTTWRWCFYLNLPVGAVAMALLIFTHIPDLATKPPFSMAVVKKVIPELDLFGFLLFVPASVMFLLALQFGGTDYPWDSGVIIGLFLGAGWVATLFAFWEWHMGDNAMFPGSVLKQKVALASAVQGVFLLGTVFVGSYYLPIYFQAVKGVSPTLSGVYLLPSVLSQLVVVIISGWGISRMGYYLPWPVAAGAMSAVGNGLLSTFSPTTTTGAWIGYQIILGAGRGAGMQSALIAVQTSMPGPQIPVGIAFQIFCQNLFGSIFLAIATAIFTQSLASQLAIHAPSVTPEAASAAGSSAEAVRALVPDGSPELEGLLLAYSNAIDNIFYMMVAFAIASFVAAFFMGWKDTRKKNPEGKDGP